MSPTLIKDALGNVSIFFILMVKLNGWGEILPNDAFGLNPPLKQESVNRRWYGPLLGDCKTKV